MLSNNPGIQKVLNKKLPGMRLVALAILLALFALGLVRTYESNQMFNDFNNSLLAKLEQTADVQPFKTQFLRYNNSCKCFVNESNGAVVPLAEVALKSSHRVSPEAYGPLRWGSPFHLLELSALSALLVASLFSLGRARSTQKRRNASEPVPTSTGGPLESDPNQSQKTPLTRTKLNDFGFFVERVARNIKNPFVSLQCLIAIEPDAFRMGGGLSKDSPQARDLEEHESLFAAALMKVCEHGPLPSVYKHQEKGIPVFLVHCPNYDQSNVLALVASLKSMLEKINGKHSAQLFCTGIAIWRRAGEYEAAVTEAEQFVRMALVSLRTAQETGMGETHIEHIESSPREREQEWAS